MKPDIKYLLAEALCLLEGLTVREIYDSYLTAIKIGDWAEYTNSRGMVVDKTDVTLLISCPWQISRGRQVFSASTALRSKEEQSLLMEVLTPFLGEPTYPNTDDTHSSIDEEEPELDLTRVQKVFEERLEREEIKVVQAQVLQGGILSVALTHNYVLTVMPNRPHGDFHWSIRLSKTKRNVYCVGPRCVYEEW